MARAKYRDGGRARRVKALLLAASLLAAAAGSQAQVEPASEHVGKKPAATTPGKASAGPSWKDLTPEQKQALAPLSGHWNRLHPAQKRKWLALSRNFDDMTEHEKATLRGRMTDWASLSPQERTRARLNYAEIERLAPADERKAKWEAYQALSPEERRKLADQATTRLPGAAVPAKPVPQRMLAPVPQADGNSQRPPKIQVTPDRAKAVPAQSEAVVHQK
ncbi:DUF3106 domain-containing protein [Variovorax dokdonensis]|uniref:DUF3106 domain-containing protein n=1 Tax=Variovorax dokdonensis TaxID=344883 RepID=A0ABT7NCL4_9BURK|nr:DUF3106 domain-containing protein [Variovorax dokdonensis]MDM0045590.1 DUF3106 domain-containing protein [Variovorax dokdonensis]